MLERRDEKLWFLGWKFTITISRKLCALFSFSVKNPQYPTQHWKCYVIFSLLCQYLLWLRKNTVKQILRENKYFVGVVCRLSIIITVVFRPLSLSLSLLAHVGFLRNFFSSSSFVILTLTSVVHYILVSQFQLCLDYFIVMLGIMTILSFSFKANFTLGKFFTANKCSTLARIIYDMYCVAYANSKRVSVCVTAAVAILSTLNLDGRMADVVFGNAKLLQHIFYWHSTLCTCACGMCLSLAYCRKCKSFLLLLFSFRSLSVYSVPHRDTHTQAYTAHTIFVSTNFAMLRFDEILHLFVLFCCWSCIANASMSMLIGFPLSSFRSQRCGICALFIINIPFVFHFVREIKCAYFHSTFVLNK